MRAGRPGHRAEISRGENVMTAAAATKQTQAPLSNQAREMMEAINTDAAKHHVRIRTQANAPAQRPWFSETGGEGSGQLASGRVAANQMKTLPYMWRWSEFSPYLHRISEIARKAEVSPIEFADRQSILLLNPGLNGRLQVTNTIRCAISIYNPGDVAPVHLHSPNASRTILSNKGGYTVVEGERCTAERGDLILTPNGTWHDHGNDSGEPVIWIDMLDWPLMEFLDAAWVDHDMPGEETELKRETAGTFYVVIEGSGATEVGGKRFEWTQNDIFVVPNFLWRRHINTGKADAVLYSVSDAALMRNIGQYYAQGRSKDGKVTDLVN